MWEIPLFFRWLMFPLVWEPVHLKAREQNNGGGGLGGKMTPCAVLVIQNGTTKLVNVKNQDGLTKVLDMVPDFVNRFAPGVKESGDSSETEV